MATNIFDLAATLTLNSEDYEKGLQDAENSAGKHGSKIGTALKGIGVAGAATFTAAFTAVVGLTKAAVSSYGEYEQLVGGVETLFGAGGKSLEEYAQSVGKSTEDAQEDYEKLMSAQDTMLKNADEAYKKQGLSANEYMQTATGMAAAMVNSLSGDTQKAASMVDMAVSDMSDNANKMGTDMSSIQYAYQGFAKQNYTMLDNLKLGYGGTKEEMERLIADANKIKEAQGEAGDLTIESYADVVEAIHTVQTEMGITGTTSKEAAGTIQGSVASASAAWKNLVTSFGRGNKETKKATKEFASALMTSVKNMVPIISQALLGIAEFVTDLGSEIGSKLPGLVADLLPKVLKTVSSLLASVGPLLLTWIKMVFKVISDVVKDIDWKEVGDTILNAITNSVKNVIEFFTSVFSEAKDAITSIDWTELGTTIWGYIVSAFDAVVTFFTTLFTDAKTKISEIDWTQLGSDVWEAIKGAFAATVEWFKTLFFGTGEDDTGGVYGAIKSINWAGLGTAILDFIKSAFDGAVNFFKGIFFGTGEDDAEGVYGAIKSIDWGKLGGAILDAIITGLGNIVEGFKALFEGEDGEGGAVGAIKSVDWVGLGAAIFDSIKSAFDTIADTFKTIFAGEDGEGGVIEAVKEIDWLGLGKAILNFIKEAFIGIGEIFKGFFFGSGEEDESGVYGAIKSIDWLGLGKAILNLIKEAFIGIGEIFKGFFFGSGEDDAEGVYGAIKSIDWIALGKAILKGIKDGFVKVVTDFKNFFFGSGEDDESGVFGAIKKIDWKGLGSSMRKKITGAFDSAKDKFRAIFEGDDGSGGVVGAIKGIKWKDVGSSMKKKIIGAFDGISDVFSEIFGGEDGEGGVVGAIKSALGGLGTWFADLFTFDIKLPHFSVNWSDLGFVSIPNISVEWYAKAGQQPYMFSNATLFGAGERGDEILYGRDNLMRDIREATAKNSGNWNVTFNITQQPGEDVNRLADVIAERLEFLYKQEGSAYGIA